MNADDHSPPPDGFASGDTTDTDARAPAGATEPGQASRAGTEDGIPTQEERIVWRREIRPYLSKLAERIQKTGVKEHSISLPIGEQRVLVSPNDQRLVLTWASDPKKLKGIDASLIDSIGLQIRMFASLRSMAKDGGLDAERHKRRLARDRNFAYSLSRQITITMRQAREDGRAEGSDDLQESRKQLHKAILEIEKLLGTEAAEVPRASQGHQFVYDWQEISKLPDSKPSTKTPAWLDTTHQAARPEPRDPTVRNHVVFALACLVLAAVLINLWVNRQRQLADFAVEDFKEIPGIEQVVNRSPTLLVVVNEEAWYRDGVAAKRRAIEAVGTLAKSAGYDKVEFRSVRTPNLAVWYRSGKIEFSK